jgi:cardiolipin synthase (CMP-forming)
MRSVLGTILDPAADKALMTTLAVTLTIRGLLPCAFRANFCSVVTLTSCFHTYIVPLAVVILGRDILLSGSAFYIRYVTLPHPVGPILSSVASPCD